MNLAARDESCGAGPAVADAAVRPVPSRPLAAEPQVSAGNALAVSWRWST